MRTPKERVGDALDYDLISPISIPPSSRIPADEASSNEYDVYFRIDRDDPSLLGWSRTCVQVGEALVDDLLLTGLTAEDRSDLLLGLVEVQRRTLQRWIALVEGSEPNASSEGSDPSPPRESTALTTAQVNALRRWKLGHHAFHLYLVAMNSLLEVTLVAATRRAWDEVPVRLETLARLYHAATAGMKYASSFSTDAYATFIRPSMSAPFVNQGFSGQLNREHALMLEGFGRLRRTLRGVVADGDAPDEVVTAANALWEAQRRNRRHHMLVCKRFVPDGVSLLQRMYSSEDEEHPG